MSFVAAISPLTLDILYSHIPRVPNLGEEVFAEAFDMQIGGGPTASLITLKRLGIEGRIGTFLAQDNMSTLAKGLLDQHHLNYINMYSGKGNPIVVTSIASFSEDRYFLTYDPRIDQNLCSDEEIYSLLTGAKVCFGVKGRHSVLKRLKEEGTIIVYDVGWSDDLHIEDLKEVLSCIHVFTPNEKEALKMTGAFEIEDALTIIDQYVDTAIITLGKDGAITKIGDRILHVPAITNFLAVDSTGAGDNFLAGIMYGLYQGWGIENCMQAGNIIGGYSTTALGCCKAEITIDMLKTYMSKYYGVDIEKLK